MDRRLVVAFTAVLALAGITGPVAAQDEPAQVLPLAPDPARCTVERRALADVRTIWEEVNADPAVSPAPTLDPAIAGTPVDDSTRAAITDLLVNVLACAANGNDGLADATYLTDAHLRDNLTGLSQEDFDGQFTESPTASDPEHWIILYDIRDPRMLPDGRVALSPDVIVPGVGRFVDLLVVAQQDGRWLIDHSQDGPGNVYP